MDLLLTKIQTSCCEHANWTRLFKSAACRILTPLKHKNTIICVQIFMKHAKLTYIFIWKSMLVGYSPLKMCVLGQNVWVCFGLCNLPTASLHNCISAPRVASWGKTQRISFHSSSCALNLCVHQVWGGGAGWKNSLQYVEFGLQYLVQ